MLPEPVRHEMPYRFALPDPLLYGIPEMYAAVQPRKGRFFCC